MAAQFPGSGNSHAGYQFKDLLLPHVRWHAPPGQSWIPGQRLSA
jgi:hypothetical protein